VPADASLSSYSPLILSRYREEALRACYGREALRPALSRTGPAVMFSSLTVAGATAALLVFPQPFLRSIALGTIFVALLAGATALSVVAAALAALGHRVDALARATGGHAASRAARPATAGFWSRLARLVMRSPGRFGAAGAIVLLALPTPSTGIATTAVDPNVVPGSSNDEGARTRSVLPTGGASSTVPQGAVASHVQASSRVARERWVRLG
jgi:trehalose monomycolate/heme transporter